MATCQANGSAWLYETDLQASCRCSQLLQPRGTRQVVWPREIAECRTLLHGGDSVRVRVWYLDAELLGMGVESQIILCGRREERAYLFDRHDDFYCVETVKTEIVGKRGRGGKLDGGDGLSWSSQSEKSAYL